MVSVGKMKVTKTVKVGEQRNTGCKGVITGVPLGIVGRKMDLGLLTVQTLLVSDRQ